MTTMLEWALWYASRGLAVFPCNPDGGPDGTGGKNPLNRNGMNGATTDPEQIRAWWAEWPDALIAARVPADRVLLDIDPRHGGDRTWDELTACYGPVPLGRSHASGRCDGGAHLWFERPEGKLSSKRLDEWARAVGTGHQVGDTRWVSGIDILHHNHRYTILPPSPHPATGQPYEWIETTSSVPMPGWLAHLITADDEPDPPPPPPRTHTGDDDSPAEWVAANWTWGRILGGWRAVRGDGETDGSMWRHPAATSAHSASIRHGILFVYSPSTDFGVTEPGSPTGYTKFRAYAVLHHRGDLSAAARAVRLDHMPRTERQGGEPITLGPRAAQDAPQGPPAVNLPDEFWDARPQLSHIRQAAHARGVSADATLGAVLARVATLTSPGWDVPPIVGEPAPLNVMVALIGQSGAGKTQSAKVARQLVPIDGPGIVADLPLGSGEGIPEAYYDLADVVEEDGKKTKERRRVNRALLLTIDEGGALAAMADRSGATLMTTLRTAWSGDTLGQANASRDARRIVTAGTYRFALIAGFQLGPAADLLGDAEGGTPQRFEMFSAADDAIPDDPPPWPGPLRLELPPTLIDAHLCADLVGIDQAVAAEVRARRLAINRGRLTIDPLDSHDDLCRLKVALLLAVIDGRRDINADDWTLAGTVRANTKAIRATVLEARRVADRDRETSFAQRLARQAAIVEGEAEQRAFRQMVAALVRKVDAAHAEGRAASRSEINQAMSSRWKKLVPVDAVIDHALRGGTIVAEEEGYRPG